LHIKAEITPVTIGLIIFLLAIFINRILDKVYIKRLENILVINKNYPHFILYALPLIHVIVSVIMMSYSFHFL
jgi:hypothetical protein